MSPTNARNVRPPFSRWQYWLYWLAITASGLIVIAVALGGLRPPRTSDASMCMIIALMLLLELGPLFRGRWERPFTSTMASSLMFVFALLLLGGLTAAVIGQTLCLLMEASFNPRPLWRFAFNVSQYAVTLAAGYLTMAVLGHPASLTSPGAITLATLPALLAAAVVAMLINNMLVGTADALRLQVPWLPEVALGFGLEPLNDGAAIALAPLVVLAGERSAGLIPLLLIPLLAVHRSTLATAALKHQAGHDALTGLPNRALLLDRVAETFAAGGAEGSLIGVFVLDLDRFKSINDTLGHQAGDQLLQVVSGRLLGAVRPGDVVARLGGDEFAVLLPDVVDEVTARAVAARITDAIGAPMSIDGTTLSVGSSLGIALAGTQDIGFETLMRRADLAMYAAKAGGDSYEVYSVSLERESDDVPGLVELGRGIG